MPRSRSKRRPRRPPPKVKPKESPAWFAALFFLLMGLGVIIIIAYYMQLLPGTRQPYEMFVGLAMILAAFILATRWH